MRHHNPGRPAEGALFMENSTFCETVNLAASQHHLQHLMHKVLTLFSSGSGSMCPALPVFLGLVFHLFKPCIIIGKFIQVGQGDLACGEDIIIGDIRS